MHRLPGDEIFHFYLGDPVEMLQLHPDGTGSMQILGNDLEKNAKPQILVPGGAWQGSQLFTGGQFALLGTTMAPGFEFTNYETSNRNTLIKKYPEFITLIRSLTTKSE